MPNSSSSDAIERDTEDGAKPWSRATAAKFRLRITSANNRKVDNSIRAYYATLKCMKSISCRLRILYDDFSPLIEFIKPVKHDCL